MTVPALHNIYKLKPVCTNIEVVTLIIYRHSICRFLTTELPNINIVYMQDYLTSNEEDMLFKWM